MNPPMRQFANPPILFGRKGKEFPFFLLVDYPHLSTPFCRLPVPGLLPLETIESVGETQHEIAGEPVGARIHNVVAGNGATDVGILFKNVVPGQPQETVLFLEKCFFQRCIQQRYILTHGRCQSIVDDVLKIIPEYYTSGKIDPAV